MIAALATVATTAWNYDHMHLSPVALDLGLVQLRWHALSYMAMILAGLFFLIRSMGTPVTHTPAKAREQTEVTT